MEHAMMEGQELVLFWQMGGPMMMSLDHLMQPTMQALTSLPSELVMALMKTNYLQLLVALTKFIL